MTTSNKILAMIDGSVYSSSVVDHAAWAANRLNNDVELMHVIGRRGVGNDTANLSGNIGLGARTSLLEELSEHDAQASKLAQKRGRLILDDASEKLQTAGIEHVTTRMRNGELVESVTSSEETVDLILIGKRGEGADFDKLHPGSNLERVVRSCTKPVLVASRSYKTIESVLVAFDGGGSCSRAIDYITNEKLLTNLPIKLLMVGDEDASPKKNLEDTAARLQQAGHPVTSEVLPGITEEVISKAVEKENHDLLVMGAYGHSRIRNMIIGSTTTAMIISCKIPVMLFR